MTAPFDPEIYPCVAAYLATLPEGLASHPECTCRADVPSSIREKFPEVYDGQGMSAEARAVLLAEWRDDEWIPDAVNIALRLMGRDRRCATDVEYLASSFEFAGEVFKRPIYRALMSVLSPTLAIMGIERRWRTFRRGTVIGSSGRRPDGTAELMVSYPPFLYPRLMSEAVGETFRAGLTATRVKNVTVELTVHTETESRYVVAWE